MGLVGIVKLPREFYRRPTLEVARDLLGKVLVHRTPEGTAAGFIVEAEAYIGEDDAACHAAPGPTKRNAVMYRDAGHAYVYLNYGIHFMMNVVTEPPGSPAAVLIRALEPVKGLALMRKRRTRGRAIEIPDYRLCRGPGNLTVALGITMNDHETDLLGRTLYIEDVGRRVSRCVWSTRIGINVGTDKRWRCYESENSAVSGPKPRELAQSPKPKA